MCVCSLERNLISDKGCESIAEGLGENATLRKLYLRFNRFTGDGVELLANGLRNNRGLIKLLYVLPLVGSR